jgi:hypothetical protein
LKLLLLCLACHSFPQTPCVDQRVELQEHMNRNEYCTAYCLLPHAIRLLLYCEWIPTTCCQTIILLRMGSYHMLFVRPLLYCLLPPATSCQTITVLHCLLPHTVTPLLYCLWPPATCRHTIAVLLIASCHMPSHHCCTAYGLLPHAFTPLLYCLWPPATCRHTIAVLLMASCHMPSHHCCTAYGLLPHAVRPLLYCCLPSCHIPCKTSPKCEAIGQFSSCNCLGLHVSH